MPVAEIFLSAFMQVLLERLASRVLLEFAKRQGIRSRLKKLEENLKMINEVIITHAENMLFRQTKVDKWLEELMDWAYDADDFLDEVNTRAMQEQAGRSNTRSSISVCICTPAIVTKVRDVVCGSISCKYSKDVDMLNSRLDTISQRMDEMRRLMKMTAATGNTSTPQPILQRPLEATEHAFVARVFGREQEKEKIIEQLKSGRDANVEVIPIVGMPGIGKTTLARHVFHTVQQQQQQEPPLFDIYGWACVSDYFDVLRITKDILESFTSRASNLSGLNQLQAKLKEVVGGKRFLLVLDDVWSRDYSNHWDRLRAPFRVGAPGSKILVTTRDNEVATMMQTDDPLKIHHLGSIGDDCWSVFLQHVVDKRNLGFESEAGRFRVKILDKCKGLPLTAKLLGGLLRGESPGQGWEAKLNSGIWDLSDNDRMLPVIMLSYFHLPAKLKRCFSYCSVLPKDYEFGEEEVVMMWMAQGLVMPERGSEQVEDTGAKYFRELVSRSLFQPSPNNPSRFLMHDLINDMAEIVAGKSCSKFDGGGNIDSSSEKARYSSYRNFRGLKMEFKAFERTKYIRSFQSFDHILEKSLTSYVPLELLMKLKYLRVLCLSSYSVRELPEDIGSLIHLRLVDLSCTLIRRLPESTSSLYNLQTLKLKGCEALTSLPTEMRKLINLRNLDCSGENKLIAMPVEMGKLTSLQMLSNFIVGKGLEQGVDQLKDLSHLKGSISISFLENVRHSNEAREANLMSKEGLRSLELKWKMESDHHDMQDRDGSFSVFDELQPHKHLVKLTINGYGGVSFPGWVGDEGFSKIRVIELANCEKCASLPPLGKLPVLEEIKIRKLAAIERVGGEFYGKERGAFPLLRILKFEDMENWSIWSYPASGGCRFACLQELHVINCPKLAMSLPDGINVQKLMVRKCDKLWVALTRHAVLQMDIGECKVELMGGDASQLPPSVTSTLMIEKVDAVESVMMRMNISSRNKDVVEAHRQKMVMMLRNLTDLEMVGIPRLTHLPGVVLQGLPKLETLRIRRCEELTSLWKMDEMGGLNFLVKQESHFLNSLRLVEVEGCCQLVCLVPQSGEEDDTGRDTTNIISQECLGLPCGLETLRLAKCDKLETLPGDLHNLASLRNLWIWDCRRLSCLPEMGFPSTLESLVIGECELITCLSSSSTGAGAGAGNGMPPLPHSLEWLSVSNCENLESLSGVGGPAFTTADSFPSLQLVHIIGCPKLKSLPEGIIHRRLKVLCIVGCDNLRELSISIHHLTALEYLRISGWPAGLFAVLQQGGSNPNSLPPNLCHLHITGPMTPNPSNNDDDQLLSVPSLPPSLTSLSIFNFKKLSPEAFQSVTSLQYLRIKDCPGLTSIPHQLLPPSLLTLKIRDCQLLAPQFARGKGRYWPAVKFIPRVEIDRRSIFDPEEEEEEEERKRFNRGVRRNCCDRIVQLSYRC